MSYHQWPDGAFCPDGMDGPTTGGVDAMLVPLPDFSQSKCQYLRICGGLYLDSDTAPAAIADKQKYPSASYEIGGVLIYARAGWQAPTAKKPRHHLHFDFARASWFERRGGAPKITITPEQLQEAVAVAVGIKYNGEVEGLFGVDEASLPESIKAVASGAKAEADGVTIELTGGTLSIRGGPVRSLRWEKGADPAGFRLDVTCPAPSKVETDFLAANLAIVESAYSALCARRQSRD